MLCLFRVLAIALSLLTAGGLTSGGAGKALKYQFKPGETYVYSVNIVGELGAATQTSKGTIQLTAKDNIGNQTQLTPKVSISTTMKQPTSPGKKGAKGGPSGGPFGKGGPGSKFAGPRELVIDAFGKVIRFSGETSLPLLLGTAEELVIEPLSAKGENRWRLDKDLVIREGERAAKGPPRTVNETNTSAKETVTYEIAGSAGSVVTIKKTYDLKTVSADGASRIQFEGTGDLAFDTQAGLIKTGEFKGTIVVTEKNLTFKIPVTASYRLLDAAEAAALAKADEEKRAKALEASKARLAAKAAPAGEVDINGALAELKSGNKTKMRNAAELLSTAAPVASRRDEVAGELAPALKDNALRATVSKALKVWGTDKAVVPLLKDSSVFVKLEACKILAEIGTNECLPALQAALSDSNGSVRREAAAAVKAVQGRKGQAK